MKLRQPHKRRARQTLPPQSLVSIDINIDTDAIDAIVSGLVNSVGTDLLKDLILGRNK